MRHFWTRCAVLLISIILLSSCGGSKSTPTSLTSQGSATTPNPLNLTTLLAPANSGQVGNSAAGKSYYRLTGLVGTYTITMYGMSADADLLVYNGMPFDSFTPDQTNQFTSNGGCASRSPGTTPEQCTVTAASTGTMNIEVDGEFALSGATYFISVVKTPAIATTCSGAGCTNFDTGNPTPVSGLDPSVYGFVQSNNIAAPWLVDCTQDVPGPGCSIHSGFTGTGPQTSCVSYTTTTTSTPSYVTFNWEASTSLYVDVLQFYIDNVLQTPEWFSTTASWQNVMFNTTTGTHTYKWCHSNSSTTISTPSDVWVDDIYIL